MAKFEEYIHKRENVQPETAYERKMDTGLQDIEGMVLRNLCLNRLRLIISRVDFRRRLCISNEAKMMF